MKKKSLLLLIPFAAMALAGCTPVGKQCDNVVVSFKEGEDSVYVEVGKEITLNINISDENCKGEIKWTSDNEQIATVSNGIVHGVAVGMTIVKANGVPCTVHVIAEGQVVLNKIEAKDYTATAKVGSTYSFNGKVIATYSDNTTKDVTAQATIGTIDTSTAGEKTGTIEYTEDGVKKTATYEVVVSENPPVKDEYTPDEVIAMCEEAGEGVVVNKEITVVGVAESGKKDDDTSHGISYAGKFANSTLEFWSVRADKDYGDLAGKNIKIKGYPEKYQGKYQIGYLKADISPTGSKYNPSLVYVEGDEPTPEKEVTEITAVSYTKTLYVGGTINPNDVSLTVLYSDRTSGTVKAERVDGYSTATAGKITATAHYKTCYKEFEVNVSEKPASQGSVYTFTNDQTTAQNMSTWTSEKFMQHVSVEGAEVITGMSNPNNAYIGGNGKVDEVEWELWDCLKIGKSKATGSITLNLDESKQFTSIKVNAIGSRDDGTLTINGETKAINKKATKDDLQPVEVEFDISGGISSLNLSTKEYTSNNYSILITSIEFVGGETPVTLNSITASGVKTTYEVGDALDLTGLTVMGHYSDGDRAITEGITTSMENGQILAATDTSLVVTAGGKSDTITLTINPKHDDDAVLDSIAVSSNHRVFYVGDTFVEEIVTAHYDRGEDRVVTGATFTGFNSSAAVASQTITVSYTENGVTKTTTYDVQIKAKPVLDSITVANASGKFNKYTEGDVISKADLVVTAHYTEGKADAVVTDYTISITRALTTDDNAATISYTEGGINKTATYTFTVTVKPAPTDPVVGVTFTKVKAAADITEGTYIVGTESGYFFNGEDVAKKAVVVESLSDSITGVEGMAGLEVKEVTGGYSLKLLNGTNKDKFIGPKSGDNKDIVFGDSVVAHEISINDGVTKVKNDGKSFMFNGAIDQLRFRYYKTAQTDIVLYKATASKTVKSVAIEGSLTKTTQYVGDHFDPTGLSVKVTYDDDTFETVTSGLTWSVDVLSAANPALAVSVSYKGTASSNSVNVEVVAKTIQSIFIDNGLTTKKYTVGDAWASDEVVVKAKWSVGPDTVLDATAYDLVFNPTAPVKDVTSVKITATYKAGGVAAAELTVTGIEVTESHGTLTEVYSFVTSDYKGSNNAYASNCDIECGDVSWNFNGNSEQQPWRFGGKNIASGAQRTLYSLDPISEEMEIDTAIVKIGKTGGGCTFNSMTFEVYSSASGAANGTASDLVESIKVTSPKAETDYTFEADEVDSWKGMYIRILFDVSVTDTKSNKYFEFLGITFKGIN